MRPSFGAHRRRDEHVASPEFTRLIFVGFGVAMLLGLVTGVFWIGWNLLRLA